MVKTTVYLSEEDAAELRRVAAVTGKSQSELIREGVRHVVDAAPRRAFHSRGAGRSDGSPPEIDPDEFYDWVMGKR
jgi:Arc/MetJ-type ribon-helix-helix transcriptional regulator